MIELQRGGVRAEILAERGGLLCSLKVGDTDLLYLPDSFDPQASGWPNGGAPLLFPFAGRCFHQGRPLRYQYQGQEHDMPLHGFAYGNSMQVVSYSADHMSLVLEQSAASKRLYPFDFKLELSYRLIAEGIETKVSVFNPNQEDMPVALGWHPFFSVPQLAQAQLDTAACEVIHVNPAGAAGKAYHAAGPFQIDQPQYKSLILGHFLATEAVLKLPDRSIGIDWQGADCVNYLTLWRDDSQEFYCVEPWMGLPDAISHGTGLKWLPPGTTLEQSVTYRLLSKMD